MSEYNVIGLMSGTSMDGLDIAFVNFKKSGSGNWDYTLRNAETFEYEESFINELKAANMLSVPQMLQLDKRIGKVYADFVSSFLNKHKIKAAEVDLIASHGQTIFHQPKLGYTYQIGCGSTLSYLTGIKVVNDFRSKDVIAGGQGAPLVPIGDFQLFAKQAESFLNIGGFTNLSFKRGEVITAFDICPGNLPLNKLMEARGLPYDHNGQLASKGEINFFLLDLLNKLPFYREDAPKSLGTEWLENQFYPLVKFDRDIENNLRTLVEHIAVQIGHVLTSNNLNSVFVTGGGAKNDFLIQKIKTYYKGEIILPESTIIDFKEAIIFAFLGGLYLDKLPNTLATVTGATRDVVGGVLHVPY